MPIKKHVLPHPPRREWTPLPIIFTTVVLAAIVLYLMCTCYLAVAMKKRGKCSTIFNATSLIAYKKIGSHAHLDISTSMYLCKYCSIFVCN